MNRGTVLMIDEERLVMVFYEKALARAGFEVLRAFGPDTAVQLAETHKASISLVVLDIMMPPEQLYQNADTANGLRTGVFLLTDLNRIMPDVPVVILTNVSDAETLASLHDGPCLKVTQKLDCSPLDLAVFAVDLCKSCAERHQEPIQATLK